MKALITGCAGFIASHLVGKLLERGYEVVGMDCFSDYYAKEIKRANISNVLEQPNFRLIEKNILDIDLNDFPEVDYVFHLAAQPGVRGSWGENFQLYTRNNIDATQKLLECYRGKKIRKFVYASSSSVYGEVELPMREDSLLKPDSPYGVTKLAGENLGYLYYRNYHVPVVSLRYFTVYGPRQRPDMAIYNFVRAVLSGDTVTVHGDGEQTRDFTYVDDVVEATILATYCDSAGEVINVGKGDRTSVNQLIGEIQRITGQQARLEYSPRQKGDVKDTWAYISKARAMLNWEPSVTIAQGLECYLNSIR